MPSVDPRLIIQGLIILILSIAVHEFAHAYIADRLGDRLPRHQGRVTLNPLAHADPIGTLLFPAIGMIFGMGTFGWGRPVQVSPASFTRKMRMRTAHMLVAAAGPGSNIAFGLLISLVLFTLYQTGAVAAASGGLFEALSYAILINFILAFFNLIPAPPLDGGTVLAGLLPDRMMPAYNRFSQYGIFVLFAFLLIPSLTMVVLGPAHFLYQTWAGQVLGMPVLR
jgi:Zn-dependent protease